MSEQQKRHTLKASSVLMEFSDEMDNWSGEEREFVVRNGVRSYQLLREAIKAELATQKQEQPILFRLYEDEEIWIEATDGTRMIADEDELFPGYLDPDFRKLGTGKPSRIKTRRVQAEVYEMRKDARFRDMIPANRFLQSQDQMLDFVERHRDKLRTDGYATFFPYMDGDDMFVARARVGSGGLEAYVHRFEYGGVWGGAYRRRVVLPQLEA